MRDRIGSLAAFTALLTSCSILAPGDDELLGGAAADASTGGVGGSAASGGSSGLGGAGGSSASGGTGTGGAAGASGSGGSGGSQAGGAAGVGGSSGGGGVGAGGAGTGGIGTGGIAGGTGGTGGKGGTGGIGTGGTGTGGGGTGGIGTGGGAATGGTAGTGGTGGASTVGCSDGTREAFKTLVQWPDVAGCSGGWSVKGVTSLPSNQPACNRISGNDSVNPNGNGCSVEDLCAIGWHVCAGASEFATKSPLGCAVDFTNALFVTRQSMHPSTGSCANPINGNNLVGCGQGVGASPPSSCDPLNTYFALTVCNTTGPWDCSAAIYGEGNEVTKDAPSHGGVICCKG